MKYLVILLFASGILSSTAFAVESKLAQLCVTVQVFERDNKATSVQDWKTVPGFLEAE